MRLIDGDALEKDIRELLFTEEEPSRLLTEAGQRIFNSAIEVALFEVVEAEVIDAVPVVRCKECKYRGTPYSCPMRKLVMPFQGAGSYEDCTEDDGYCHMGAKKDGGAER